MEKEDLITKLEAYQKKSYSLGFGILKGYASLYAWGIQYAIMAAIYLYVYSIAGIEITAILVGIGLISSNIKDRVQYQADAYMKAEREFNKKMTRVKNGRS